MIKKCLGMIAALAIVLFGYLLLDGIPGSTKQQDISTIRQTFHIPDTVEPFFFQAVPETPGQFGREGLKIRAVFPLSPEAYQNYAQETRRDKSWHTLPASKEVLSKSQGLGLTFKTLQVSAQTPENLPKTIDDPYYQNWLKKQHSLNIRKGAYKCLTAGNSIMHNLKAYPKVECLQKPGKLNDFMLAVLDGERHHLDVIVHSRY